ncbi:unnamed protein product, partial [Meganyctiphanes norvegica]
MRLVIRLPSVNLYCKIESKYLATPVSLQRCMASQVKSRLYDIATLSKLSPLTPYGFSPRLCCLPLRQPVLEDPPFVKKLLHEHFKDYRDTCVTISLPHIPAYCISYILDFIYCGTVNIHPKVFENVLEVAKLLEVSCLLLYFKQSLCFGEICMPIQKQNEKKPMKNKVLQSIKTNRSNIQDANIFKEDKSGFQLSRSSRKIKSRYSSDIYEMNIPKLRKTRSKKINEIGNMHPIDLKQREIRNADIKEKEDINQIQYIEGSQNSLSFATNPGRMKDLNLTCSTIISQVKDKNKVVENKLYNVSPSSTFALDLSSSKLPESMKNVTKNDIDIYKGNKNSLNSSYLIESVIAPNHIAQKYKVSNLSEHSSGDSNSEKNGEKKITVNALQNATAVHIEDNEFQETTTASIDVIKAFETQVFDDGELTNTTSSILNCVQSELSKEGKSTVGGHNCFTLEQLDISMKPSEVSLKPSRVEAALSRIDNIKQDDGDEIEEEEEDGLFKLQVLLKECEDFPDPEGVIAAVDDRIEIKTDVSLPEKYSGADGSIDFNQWISEEIHNYMMPKGESSNTRENVHENLPQNTNEFINELFSIDEIKNHIISLKKNKSPDDTLVLAEKVNYGQTKLQSNDCTKTIAEIPSKTSKAIYVCNVQIKVCKSQNANCNCYFNEHRCKFVKPRCHFCRRRSDVSSVVGGPMSVLSSEVRYPHNTCSTELSTQILTQGWNNHECSKSYQCSIWDKKCSQNCLLIKHQIVHTGEKPYQCSQCDKTFTHKNHLKVRQRMHTREKPYQCSQCGKAFSQHINLICHYKMHTGEKPYQCRQCDKAFSHKQVLIKHQRTHTGEKPYQCSQCDKTFSRKNIREHNPERNHINAA